MTIDALIQKTTESILKNVRQKLLDAWLKHYKSDINKEVEDEQEKQKLLKAETLYQQEMAQYRRDFTKYQQQLSEYTQQENYPSSSIFNPIKQNKKLLIKPEKPREPKKKDKENLSNYEIEKIRTAITNNYTAQFTKRWDSNIKDALVKQINVLQPQELSKEFFIRHSWLRAELQYIHQNLVCENSIAYNYLYQLLSQHLLSSFTSEKITAWKELSKEQLTSKSFVWNTALISSQWLKEHIAGYPLSNIR